MIEDSHNLVGETGTAVSPTTEPVSKSASKRKPRKFKTPAAPLLFLLPAGIYMLAFYGFPIVSNLIMGFQKYTAQTFYTGDAPFIGWENYRKVVTSPIFNKAVINTFLFTIGSIAGQFTIGMGLALFFKTKFPLSGTFRSVLLLPWLIPMIVSSAVWRWILDKDNGVLNRLISWVSELFGAGSQNPGWLTDTSLALVAVIVVNIWIGIPFNMTLLYGGLMDIPEELYEAASLDGASKVKQFMSITWPLLRSTVNIVLVLGVVYTLKVLDIILGLTGGGPANATQTLSTRTYQLSFVSFDFGQGAAVSNILILISLVFAFIYVRGNKNAVEY